MDVSGTVKNGVIVCDGDAKLPEGAKVVVRYEPESPLESIPESDPPHSLRDMLLKHAGTLTGMPADFAAQHDHYIHGTPKR